MQGMSDITCYTCGKQGHMSFDCGKAVDRPWPADAAALDAPVPRFLLLHSDPTTINTRFAMEPFPGDYASPQHLVRSEKQLMISNVQAKSAAAFGAICGPVRADQKRAILSTRPASRGASGLPGLDAVSWKLKDVEKLPGGKEMWNNYLVCVSRLNKGDGTHAPVALAVVSKCNAREGLVLLMKQSASLPAAVSTHAPLIMFPLVQTASKAVCSHG